MCNYSDLVYERSFIKGYRLGLSEAKEGLLLRGMDTSRIEELMKITDEEIKELLYSGNRKTI